MLKLEIIGPQAAKLGAAASKVFDSAGGTIGRSLDNDWVIPDSYISGCHARVHFRNGRFFVVDCSANGTSLTTRANRLTKGQWYPLISQDHLFLDSIEIRIHVTEAADASSLTVAMPSASQSLKESNPLESARTTPLAMPADAVLAALFKDEDISAAQDRLLNTEFMPPLHSQRAITPAPDDHLTARTVALMPGAVPSYDMDMSDADAEASRTLVLQRSPESTPPAKLSTMSSHQPGATPAAPVAPAASSRSPAEVSRAALPGMTASEAAASLVDTMRIKSLLEGAGIPTHAITPELNDTFGKILRVTIGGLMQLLHERDEMKDSFRLSVTKFKPAENNPLRFSANVDDALYNLLVKRNTAYLAPADAIASSFKDAQWHQAAMVVAMRAAFDGLLKQFDPQRLESASGKRAKPHGFLFGNKDRQHWAQYRERYAQLTGQPDHGFEQLFGERFARAYQQELDRLRDQEHGSQS